MSMLIIKQAPTSCSNKLGKTLAIPIENKEYKLVKVKLLTRIFFYDILF